MYNNSNSPQGQVTNKPTAYMQELLEGLDSQLKRYEDLSNRINIAANKIQIMPTIPSEPVPKNESVPGYLGTLSSRVDMFRHGNNHLENIVAHLENCI